MKYEIGFMSIRNICALERKRNNERVCFHWKNSRPQGSPLRKCTEKNCPILKGKKTLSTLREKGE